MKLKKFKVTVRRMRVWHVEVEAEDAEDAKDKGDALADSESPDDDYAYETTAREA